MGRGFFSGGAKDVKEIMGIRQNNLEKESLAHRLRRDNLLKTSSGQVENPSYGTENGRMIASSLIETYARFPIELVDGSGTRVRAANGREYWDFYGGHAVALLGHSHPAITRAIAEQAAKLTFYSNIVSIKVREQAAERLCAFAGAGLAHVWFCNSGGEANENALKLAIQQTGRRRIAGVLGGWHGRMLLPMAVTTDEKIRAPYEPLFVDAIRIRPNTSIDLGLIDERIAAVILEPIFSIGGIVELQADFLNALRRRCDEVGAMLIYDEIQTGVGRLGRPYAAGEFGVQPDMVTSAKGLANGMPIGAILMTERVADCVQLGDLGSTFGGGPVVCAALVAVLDVIESEGLLAHAARLGDIMRAKLLTGPVRQVRGRGCLIGLVTARPAKEVHQQLMERGFLTGTSADAAVLRLMPPINTPLEAVGELAAALADIGD
jgi:acetylornithine/N-succinyldiaminopimelate aminotransferase